MIGKLREIKYYYNKIFYSFSLNLWIFSSFCQRNQDKANITDVFVIYNIMILDS